MFCHAHTSAALMQIFCCLYSALFSLFLFFVCFCLFVCFVVSLFCCCLFLLFFACCCCCFGYRCVFSVFLTFSFCLSLLSLSVVGVLTNTYFSTLLFFFLFFYAVLFTSPHSPLSVSVCLSVSLSLSVSLYLSVCPPSLCPLSLSLSRSLSFPLL